MKDDDKTLLTIATLAVGALTLFGAYKQLSDRVKKDEQKTGSDTEPDIERKVVKPSEPVFRMRKTTSKVMIPAAERYRAARNRRQSTAHRSQPTPRSGSSQR